VNVRRVDVVVIGGGPAGSAAASVLARAGRRVVLFEKETFPRYHIGESLIPFCYFPLERMGALEKMKASSYQKKLSVQFVSTNGEVSTPFYFFQHMDHECTNTWQVLRSDFDMMLLNHAREMGAEVHEATPVKEILWSDDRATGVRAFGPGGETHVVEAPVTIDCSGRDALSMSRLKWRRFDPWLNKVAVWTYFEDAVRDPGVDEGATTVAYIPDKGWFWYIPLDRKLTSVGVVADGSYLFRDTRDLAAILAREVRQNRWIEEHLAPGRQVDTYRATQEYTYRSQHCAIDGLVLAGDAFAFLDPIFSSGVFLALQGGVLAADAAQAAIEKGDTSAVQFTEYGRKMVSGIEAMRSLVYAFYDKKFSFRTLFEKRPELRGPVTDCLIGNLFIDFEEIWKKARDFARLPEPLPQGTPFVKPQPVASPHSA